jgi:hypothetical protein
LINFLPDGRVVLGGWWLHPTRESVENLTQQLSVAGLVHSCMTCRHFNEKSKVLYNPQVPEEQCELYSLRPPAKVIAFGCPSWSDDVPF